MTAAAVPRCSVVVPVYRNVDSLPELVERLSVLASAVVGGLEVVFVVDGSPDASLVRLRELLPGAGFESQLLAHSRNFGSFAAIRTGMSVARGDYIAVMAADLQEPVELVQRFFEELATQESDIVVGVRTARRDPSLSSAFSRAYWGLYRRLIQPEMPRGGVDVFASTAQVARDLVGLAESNSSLVGLLFWLGYRRTEVPYERLERRHGRSAWSFRKKFSYLLDSVFSFTSLPITVILMVGVLGTLASLVVAFIVLVSWLAGAIPVPGYAATMLVLLFSTGAVLSALGIVGTYVWRTFENTKNRPASVVMSHETITV